jgi:predicted nucleic acid-binding protein
MKRYVVDASVILKWILGDKREPDQDKALSLLEAWLEDQAEIFAPTLWEYEVGNFLGREFPDQASEKMNLLLNLRFGCIPLTEKMHHLCFTWMAENGVTFYDACYLAVSEETRCILITADTKSAQRMRHQGSICLLRDL